MLNLLKLTKRIKLKWLIIILLSAVFFASCGVLDQLGITSFGGQYSLIPTEGLSTNSIPNDQYFYVNLKESYYIGNGFDPLDAIIYALDEGPGVDCKIEISEESTEDLYCILEIMEGDLWFHRLVLEYNVPEGMCDYLDFNVPWHYNQKVGEGPPRVQEGTFTGGEGENATEETRYCLPSVAEEHNNCIAGSLLDANDPDFEEGCTRLACEDQCTTCQTKCMAEEAACTDGCDADDACTANCTAALETCESKEGCSGDCSITGPICSSYSEADCDDSSAPFNCSEWRGYERCRASCGHNVTCEREIQELCGDLDQSENDLANCCLGEYTLISEDNNRGSPTAWGGDFQNCIGGLARLNWDHFTNEGVPIGVVENTLNSGFRDTYEIPALIESYEGTKRDDISLSDWKRPGFIISNYWENVEDKDSVITKPDIFNPPDRNSIGTPNSLAQDQTRFPHDNSPLTGYPYLTWTCSDKAREIKHRIHLVVREWNTQEEYNDFKDSEGGRGDPDVVGQEGSACDYYTSDEADFLIDTDCNDALDLDDWEQITPSLPYPEIIYN